MQVICLSACKLPLKWRGAHSIAPEVAVRRVRGGAGTRLEHTPASVSWCLSFLRHMFASALPSIPPSSFFSPRLHGARLTSFSPLMFITPTAPRIKYYAFLSEGAKCW